MTEDQFVLLMTAGAIGLCMAHLMKDEPKAPVLAGAVLLLCMMIIIRRLVF